MKDKKYYKVRDHCHYTGEYWGAALSICNLENDVPKKVPIAFHNGFNYDYHFIIKEFKKQFTCLKENTEKYIILTVPIVKEVTRNDKNGEKLTKNIIFILQFIDRTRFIARSSSNLVNNFSRGIHKIKCKQRHGDKKCETCGIKRKYCNCFVEYTNFKNGLIENKCLSCNKNYQQKFDEKLKERFFNTYKFFNHDNNEFNFCWEVVFILMNIWMIRKNSMKYNYLKKKIFRVT